MSFIPSPRGHFSLRPLLSVGVLVLPILVLTPTLRAEDIRAAIIALGGKVEDFKDRPGQLRMQIKATDKLTPEQWKELSKMTNVVELTTDNAGLNDDTVDFMAGMTGVEVFRSNGAHLTDKGLQAFAAFQNMRDMGFWHIFWGTDKFNGSGLAVLATLPKLESFFMGGCTLTDVGLVAIGKATGLKKLQIWHTMITDAGVANLADLQQLQELMLAPQFSTRLSDACVPHLVKLKALQKLSLGEMRLTFEGGLKLLKNLPNLKELNLDKVEVPDDADLVKLKALLPNVKIKHTPPDEKGLEALRKAYEPAQKKAQAGQYPATQSSKATTKPAQPASQPAP